MHANPRFWAGRHVCVTGGTGFLGWHIVQALLPLAAHVRILGLVPQSPLLLARLKALDCVVGDIRDAALVRRALDGCDVVFHAAGTTAMAGPGLKALHSIHVEGTERVLDALRSHTLPACRVRLVHTSSITTIGAAREARPQCETSSFGAARLGVAYIRAKVAAERLALAAATHGLDVTVVNPGYLFGPEDFDRSAMGRLCLRAWRGQIGIVPPGGINAVDVRDVALGHLLAAERGRVGQRFILGGENVTAGELLYILDQTGGLTPRWRPRIASWLYGVLAIGAEVRAYLRKREPFPSLQHYRLSRLAWRYSSQRAADELGYQPRGLHDSLRDAHAWARETGFLPSPGEQKRQAA